MSGALALVLGLACGPATAGPDAGADGGAVTSGGFDDHTRQAFDSAEDLQGYLLPGAGRSQTKFVITRFDEPGSSQVVVMQGTFYGMHDEWYWFRLLNGRAVVGLPDKPVRDLSFDTVAEIVAWAEARDPLHAQSCSGDRLGTLPLDLCWAGDDRLYSPRFYRLGLDADRVLGLGSLVLVPARTAPEPREAQWLFELEYSDAVTHGDVQRFFQALERSLPDAVGQSIRWVTRSPYQRALAERMRAEQLAYWDRVTSYDELVVPGETEVYNPGLVAGRLRLLQTLEEAESATGPDEVLILGTVPDYLPPCAALITALPQTPLAHINILARNRGIPNAYLAGVLDDPQLDQLARASIPVVVRATAPDQLQIVAMSFADYNSYRRLQQPLPVTVSPVDLELAPRIVDLGAYALEEVTELRPLIGGKSAGMLALLAALTDPAAAVAPPPEQLAITIKPFVEHLAPLRPRIEAMLMDADFVASDRVRALVLEGAEGYDARFAGPGARAFRQSFVAARPAGDLLGDLVRTGGLVQVVRDQEIAAATLVELEAALEARFGHYAATQGLRFRSSSNVEDIQGFNGAGLYTSNSGFLDAAAQPDPDDQKKTVAWALKKTWASYWGAEAFEERRLAKVDHLSGAMGVLVHARFDDAAELANGVLTMTLQREGQEQRATMDINSQVGALSVTNPEDPAALPEVCTVWQVHRKAPVEVHCLGASTELPPGARVLDDATLRELFVHAREVAERWLDVANAELSAGQRSRTLVLDLEHRVVAEGWPALTAGTAWPRRLILKQARSLEPGLPAVGEDVLRLAFPRDVLARSRRIERRLCTNRAFSLLTAEAYTDPDLRPDLGYGQRPFNAYISLAFNQDLPELGIAQGDRKGLTFTGFDSIAHPEMGPGTWDLLAHLTLESAAAWGFDQLALGVDGAWSLARGETVVSGDGTACEVTVLYTTPEDFLLGLLP